MKFGSVVLTILTVAFVAGCGKSNPAEKYSSLKGEPVSDKKPDSQAVGDAALRIDVNDNVEGSEIPHFMEGQESSIKISVRILDPKIQSTILTMEGAPSGSRLENTTEFNIWKFVWAPPVNYIQPGQVGALKKVKFHARVVDAHDNRLKVLGTSQVVQLAVTKNMSVPEIVAINNFNDKTVVQEGNQLPISIDVWDKTGNPTAPILETPAELPNKENYKADASKLLGPHPNAPTYQNLGNGKWRFNYVIDLRPPRIMPIPYDRFGNPDPKADSVRACLNAKATVGSQSSVVYTKCFTVAFAVRNPVVKFSEAKSKFTATTANQLTFTAAIPGGHGALKINTDEINGVLKKWDNVAKLECTEPNAENASTCTLNWQPTCKAQLPVYTLRGKASNGNRTTNFEHKIELQKPEECKAEAAAAKSAAKASAKAPAKKGGKT